MNRFNILDYFLSGSVYAEAVDSVTVLHHIDNLSDHDAIVLQLCIDVKRIGVSARKYTSHLSWAKASDAELSYYRSLLSEHLHRFELPVEALICCDCSCYKEDH